jgi:hypothetical protein
VPSVPTINVPESEPLLQLAIETAASSATAAARNLRRTDFSFGESVGAHDDARGPR